MTNFASQTGSVTASGTPAVPAATAHVPVQLAQAQLAAAPSAGSDAAATAAVPPAARTGAVRVSNQVRLGVVRADVKSVQIIDTDFVVTLRNGRKVVVPDGAVKSMLDPDFSLAFADGDVLGNSVLQSAGPLEVSTISTTSVGSASEIAPLTGHTTPELAALTNC